MNVRLNNEESEQNGKMTIGDVAEALGVSKTTVSRAISGKGRIGEQTRQRVIEYINKHNFTPNAIAKSLAQSRTFNIGWVMPGDCTLAELPFFNNCLWGVSETASALQYDILVSMVNGSDIVQLERAVTNNKIDGVILSRTVENDAAAQYLMEMKIPVITIGQSEIKGILQIDNDHKAACRELTSLLILKGIKNMGLIGGNHTHIVTKKRLNGFMQAYEDAGIPIKKDNIYLDVENQVRTEKVVEELLSKDVDCIVCMDDSICMHALNKLKKENISVPDDIMVASFYNSVFLESYSPSVSTLAFDAVALGREACRTLVDYIDGKEVPQKTLLGYDIILKESTLIKH